MDELMTAFDNLEKAKALAEAKQAEADAAAQAVIDLARSTRDGFEKAAGELEATYGLTPAK